MNKILGALLAALLLAPLAQAEAADAPETPALPELHVAERAAAVGSLAAQSAADAGAASATALRAFGAQVASLAAAVGSLLALGAIAGYDIVRAHPRESMIAAGGAGGFALLWALAKRFGGLVLLPLYTRLAPSQMLDNKARSAVYAHVRANPGAHPSAIAEALGLGWGTVVYHLVRLEESSLVTSKAAHHRKCYFVVGGEMNAEARSAVAAMSNDKAKLIVQAVRGSPGISQKAVAEKVGMSQALMSWHVKRLVESGVLLARREGRSNALDVAAHVPDATAFAVA